MRVAGPVERGRRGRLGQAIAFQDLDADFIVGDELTPSMKVKRKRIAEKYGADIEAIYAEKKSA